MTSDILKLVRSEFKSRLYTINTFTASFIQFQTSLKFDRLKQENKRKR